MQSDRIRLSVAERRAHAERAMRDIGYDAEEAYIVADHEIDAALFGYEYSGLAKLLNIPELRRFKQPRLPIRVLRETEVSALYDGGNNFGTLAIYHAARAAIAKTATHGFAIVGVTNSWINGRRAYYVEMIAKADLIGIHTVGSARTVAPPGSTRPALGTNPNVSGLPSSRGPIVFDMGTSAFMGTDLAYRERMPQLLPERVAVGPEGCKGFGLALIVQAFGLLAASALDPDKDDGYLFVVFKPDLLADLDDFKRQLGELIERSKATPRQPEVIETRIPGERAFHSRGRALREGIEIDRLVYEALGTLKA